MAFGSVADTSEITFCCTSLHLPIACAPPQATKHWQSSGKRKRPQSFRDDTLLVTGMTGAKFSQSGEDSQFGHSALLGPRGRTLNHSPIDNLVLAELTVLDTLVGYRNIFAKLKYNNQLTLGR
jgi:hypothetical protein